MRVPTILAVGSSVALAAVGIASLIVTKAETALRGDCTSDNRMTNQEVYSRLALKLVYGSLSTFRVREATPESVAVQLDKIEKIRADVPKKISDKCLAQKTLDWLDYYTREASGALAERERLGGYSDEYSKKRAEEEDQVRALARALGNPSKL